MVDRDQLKQLLKQLADGQISRPDYEILIGEVQRLQAEETLYEGLDEIWEQLQQHPAYYEIPNETLYQAIVSDERFAPQAPAAPAPRRTGLYRFLHGPWRQMAAGLLIIGCMAVLYLIFKPNQQPVAQKVKWHQLITSAGERKKFKLPDSTSIWLNAGSKLIFANTFNAASREVFLEGEAFFDVTHNTKLPFIVNTGKVSTQVEGTAFDVKAYDTTHLTVTVLRGRVRVAAGDHRLAMLTANKQLQYVPRQNKVDVLAVQAAHVIAWKNGELILNNISMQEAAIIIGRWFNVDITFKNQQVKKCKISVSFLRGENIQEVMEVICRLNDLNYRITGKQIVVGGKGCF
jgi:transmembrane sensor